MRLLAVDLLCLKRRRQIGITKESRLLSDWLWYHVLLQVLPNVSEEHAASVFRVEVILPRKWKQLVIPNR